MTTAPSDINASRYPPMPARVRIPVHPFGWGRPQWKIVHSLQTVDPGVAEDRLADYLGDGLLVRAFDSGTAALLAVLRAAALPRGGQVLLPTFVCPSVAEAVIAAELNPVLFDSERNADPSPGSLATRICSRSVAVILPDYYGRISSTFQHCERLAREHGLFVIADAAQSFGCRSGDGSVAARGDAAILSFGRTKPLNAWSGGAVATRDANLFDRLRTTPTSSDRAHAAAIKRMRRDILLRSAPRWVRTPGSRIWELRSLEADVRPVLQRQTGVASSLQPARMAGLAASLLVSQLDHFDQRLARWAAASAYLRGRLGTLDLLAGDSPRAYPVHFPLLVPPNHRYRLATHLSVAGIQTTWFHYPLHLLPAYRSLAHVPLRVADWLWPRILCIPCRDLKEPDLVRVAAAVVKFASPTSHRLSEQS